MDLRGFELISTNCDILIHIYNLLDFEDQLRLAQVNAMLKSVFENFIWTMDYKTLIINQLYDNFIVTNETGVNRLHFHKDGLGEFLKLYIAKVKRLSFISHSTIVKCVDINDLRHVLGTKTDSELMQLLDTTLPSLESLQMVTSTYAAVDNENVVVLDEANVGSLLQMKNLKALQLKVESDRTTVPYRCFCEIILQMKLDILKLRHLVVGDPNIGHSTLPGAVSLKELDITMDIADTTFASFFGNHLEHLSSLTLRIFDDNEVTEENLAMLATACPNLLQLTITGAIFSSLKTFPLPPKVTELSVRFCSNLSYNNLREILTETNLTKYTSYCTNYQGEFEDFQISPLIHTLDVDAVDMTKFRSAYNSNDNLRHLTWSSSDVPENANGVVSAVSLASCINLQTFHMKCGQMALDTILQLKHLQKMSTYLCLPRQWSYICTLLSLHSSLTELFIQVFSDLSPAFDTPMDGVCTNITSLKVHFCWCLNFYTLIESSMDFLLDLLSRNHSLKLAISTDGDDWQTLMMLIKHKKFPKRLPTIQYYGFTLKCDDLRKNFDKYKGKCQYSRSVCNSYDEICAIILHGNIKNNNTTLTP